MMLTTRTSFSVLGPALLLAMATAGHAQDGPLVPQFVAAPDAGISAPYQGEYAFMVGGGVASFDCSGDGFPELYIAGGSDPARLYRNESARGGDLRFVEHQGGLGQVSVLGAYPLDIDSDGRMDLIQLQQGKTQLMRGLGDCRFENANAAWGFATDEAWTPAAAAIWERGSSWPTIALGAYIDLKEEAFPWGSCTDNTLHRPNAAGTGFAPALPLTPSFCALSMLFTDWSGNGQPALRIANDREYYKGGTEQMWRLDPGSPPALYTAKDGWKPLKIWGMGIAGRDLDADGRQEYFVTSMADNKLQKLVPAPADAPQGPTYADTAFAAGVTAHRPYTGDDLSPSTAWHAVFEDANNDGRVDLYVVKGNVDRMPDFALADPNNLLLGQDDGTFVEVGDKAGIASTGVGRGGALVDLNMDGLLDMVAVNRRTAPEVWRNATAGAGHWIGFRLSQPGPNPDGIGAMVELRQGDRLQRRELVVGGGHAGGHAGWWHFGLGENAVAELRVLWPDGTVGDWQSVAADAFSVIAKDGPPVLWSPRD